MLPPGETLDLLEKDNGQRASQTEHGGNTHTDMTDTLSPTNKWINLNLDQELFKIDAESMEQQFILDLAFILRSK